MPTTPIARKTEIVVQDLGKEILIYDLEVNKALSLNETSALIWQLSTGERTISEIAQEASKKLNVEVDDKFVWLALWRLKKENLIETDISDNYKGATRREIIKKVGFASLVTLPIITSLIAPTAIQAQSGASCSGAPLALNCLCSVPESCASTCCGVTTSASNPRFCVPLQGDPPGAFCRSTCECSGGCCGFGPTAPVCVDCGSVAPGARCRTLNECASGNCLPTPTPGVAICA